MSKWILVLVGIALLGVLGTIPTPPSTTDFEFADTPEEREQGLSGRTSVPEGGLLFVFPEKGSYGFWMKDMLIPIDIIWLTDDGIILGIEASVAPSTFPQAFYPPEPVRYVLEVAAGESVARGWSVGTNLQLPWDSWYNP